MLYLIIPALIALYIWILRRKRRYAVSYSSLALIRAALPKRSRWRQHIPFALLILSLTSLITALTRPAAELEVPLNRTTIILALDVSRSMCAVDVDPNRLAVAQDAAVAFIENQADGTRIGVVAFAGFAEIIIAPTNDKETLVKAIQNLTTSLGTAIGSATLKSIDAIAEVNEAVALSGVNLNVGETQPEAAASIYQPDIIVLLTDGANTRGPHPLDAAEQAADRLVRVFTIGFGTTEESEIVCSQEQLGGDVFSGGFGGGFSGGFSGGFGGGRDFRRYLYLDEPTLKGMAEITGGEYFRAENADQLFEVFKDLPTLIVLQKEHLEISVLFLALGALLALTAVWLSLRWNQFP